MSNGNNILSESIENILKNKPDVYSARVTVRSSSALIVVINATINGIYVRHSTPFVRSNNRAVISNAANDIADKIYTKWRTN